AAPRKYRCLQVPPPDAPHSREPSRRTQTYRVGKPGRPVRQPLRPVPDRRSWPAPGPAEEAESVRRGWRRARGCRAVGSSGRFFCSSLVLDCDSIRQEDVEREDKIGIGGGTESALRLLPMLQKAG